MREIPRGKCRQGYTSDQIEEIVSDKEDFWQWMRGQTMTICDGRSWNHTTGKYEQTGPGPHGSVVYSWDLKRYLAGLPVID